MSGIPLKAGKDKVAARVEALGAEPISSQHVVAIRTTDERAASLQKDIGNFEANLSDPTNPNAGQQLGGKFNYASQHCASGCGRSFVAPATNAKGDKVSKT